MHEDLVITVGDTKHEYSLYLPATHDGRSPLPLWVQLHGVGGTGSREARNLSRDAEAHGFVVVGPNADIGNAGWTWRADDEALDLSISNPDVALVDGLVDELAGMLCIDRARVYVAGHSGGGEGASVLACVLADRFAAAASVSGMLDVGDVCAASRPVPYLHIHGTTDDRNLFDGAFWGEDNEFPVAQAMVQTPIPERLAGIAERNGCAEMPAVDRLDGDVERWTWDCPSGAEVGLVVHAGGHPWPIEGFAAFGANAVVWEFFEAHAMPE